MSIPNFTLRLALLPLLGTLVTAKAQDYTVAQAGKSIVFDYAQNNPPPESASTPEPAPTPEPPPVSQATPEPTPAQKAAPAEPSKHASVEAPLPTGGAATPTGNVTINLINKLVKRGILDADEAKEMIRQAEAEAEAVRSQSQTDMVAIAQAAAVQVVAASTPVESGVPAASYEDIRVTHIPQPVKDQIKEEIKLELATDKVSNQISSAVRLPKWVERVKPFLDVRVRYAGTYFPSGNEVGAFPNFNAINSSATPFDANGSNYSSQLNVNEDRNQYFLRMRFGADIAMGENFSSGFRVATGSNNSPTSTNQSLGLVNSGVQGGNFSKYAIWLDRAFIRYDAAYEDMLKGSGWIGRFDNPFFSTPLIWDDDLGFDGAAVNLKVNLTENFQVFGTGGAFAVYNTALNFSSAATGENFASYDKYLLGVQTGIDWKIADDWKFKIAAAYYSFYNIEGQLSTPYIQYSSSDPGSTDQTRPSFAQKGNSYFPIRQVESDPSNTGIQNNYQYYGLATKFNDLALTARLDYNGFEPVQVSLVSEFVSNMSFNKSDIENIGANSSDNVISDNRVVNNRSEVSLTNPLGAFDGSGIGWFGELRVGTPKLAKLWDWQLNVGYRWVGSDAVVDGFNDSDFGWGGTNMQGFTVGGFLSLSENVYLGARWMGADSITGPQYNTNILYFEINSKF
jgi:polyhydroxyalkanoate synthesis regulator phasin